MPSEGQQKISAFRQTLADIKGRDASCGTLCHAVFDAEHKSRTVKLLCYSRCDNPQNSLMPTLACKNDRRAIVFFPELRQCLLIDLALYPLPSGIQTVEP